MTYTLNSQRARETPDLERISLCHYIVISIIFIYYSNVCLYMITNETNAINEKDYSNNLLIPTNELLNKINLNFCLELITPSFSFYHNPLDTRGELKKTIGSGIDE